MREICSSGSVGRSPREGGLTRKQGISNNEVAFSLEIGYSLFDIGYLFWMHIFSFKLFLLFTG
jgi:hypothetical protein